MYPQSLSPEDEPTEHREQINHEKRRGEDEIADLFADVEAEEHPEEEDE